MKRQRERKSLNHCFRPSNVANRWTRVLRYAALTIFACILQLAIFSGSEIGAAQGIPDDPDETLFAEGPSASSVSAVEGYYKDLFIEAGYKISNMTTLPAAEALGLSTEYLATGNTDEDIARQNRLVAGDPGVDDNGLMLYPDGAPRFRIVYIPGGTSWEHGPSLGEDGRQRFRDYFRNGGSYTGTCAGAKITALHYDHNQYLRGPDGVLGTEDDNTPFYGYFHIWPGSTDSTDLGGKLPDIQAIPGMENHPFWDLFPSLQDGWVNDCTFNGGPPILRNDVGDLAEMAKTEFLGRYVLAEEPTIHLNAGLLAYKRDQKSGRLVIIGCHPEGATSGERLDLMKAMVVYALQGSGAPQVKAGLLNGEPRLMNDNAVKDHEKIGDRQYHHFTIDVPGGTAQLEVALDAPDGYNLDLYLKRGAFAFLPAADYKSESAGPDERIVVENPGEGTWYVGAKLTTTATYNPGNYDNYYTGNTAVLNGVAYTLRARWTSEPPPPPPVPELLAHWTLDEETGTRDDDSARGNHLADLGGVGASLGRLSSAANLELDQAQYLSPNAATSDLDIPGSFTLVGWIKPESLGQTMILAGKHEWDVANRSYRFLIWEDGRLRLDTSPDGTYDADKNILEGSTILDLGRWHHVAAVFDAVNQTMSIYLDGTLDASRMVGYSTLHQSTAPFMLGANLRAGVVTQHYDGLLDDWRVYSGSLSQAEIRELMSKTTFADVPFEHSYHDPIEALYRGGYTAGCNTEPLTYCPDQTMNRAESAVFVERGIDGTDDLPPQPSTQTFADLPLDSWAAKWAEALWQDQYTAGCGTDPLVYCPWQGHTRAEGCVFYLHMLNGATYEPPQPSQQRFADVPLDTWYAKWVQAAYDAGLITACQTTPDLRFCPNDPLSRALAAYMMVQAKGLDAP